MKIRFVDILVILFMVVLAIVLFRIVAMVDYDPLFFATLIPLLILVGGLMWGLTREWGGLKMLTDFDNTNYAGFPAGGNRWKCDHRVK